MNIPENLQPSQKWLFCEQNQKRRKPEIQYEKRVMYVSKRRKIMLGYQSTVKNDHIKQLQDTLNY